MHIPSNYRERYGTTFILELPDGLVIPFSLLSLSDYFKFTNDLSSGLIAPSILENEIFSKCVKDSVLIENLHKQKAGTPTVVANTILNYSAPKNVEELQYFLNFNRQIINNALYQIINLICLGFPAYTPDVLLEKNVHEIMFLLALAERKLLESGMLKEPLSFDNISAEGPAPVEKKKSKIDIQKLKEVYEQQKIKPPPKEWNAQKRKESGDTKLNESFIDDETPVFEDKKDKDGKIVISGQELAYNLDCDPTSDSPTEKQMLKEAKAIFGDYIANLKKGEKIKIKDVDSRVEEAKQRMELNRQKLLRKQKEKKK